MRKKKPMLWENRVKKKFLLFPMTLQNKDRVNCVSRWMEHVEILEYYKPVGVDHKGDGIGRWTPVIWNDI